MLSAVAAGSSNPNVVADVEAGRSWHERLRSTDVVAGLRGDSGRSTNRHGESGPSGAPAVATGRCTRRQFLEVDAVSGRLLEVGVTPRRCSGLSGRSGEMQATEGVWMSSRSKALSLGVERRRAARLSGEQ
eukprot:scaffold305799_cov32-Tisochrysis_lutea.AAC.1